MKREDLPEIPIHPPGLLSTNPIMEQELKLENPSALKTSQDLLVACEKLIHKKGGFFSSEKKRQKKALESINQLIGRLRMDIIFSKQHPNTADLLLTYLAKVATAYPNWQDVYMFLNEMIPDFYNNE